MDYKIVNGTVVTAADAYRTEVGVAKGKIVQIAKRIKEPATEVVDAEGHCSYGKRC
jgi:dihydroorotase-like cyclic amidohydrolase